MRSAKYWKFFKYKFTRPHSQNESGMKNMVKCCKIFIIKAEMRQKSLNGFFKVWVNVLLTKRVHHWICDKWKSNGKVGGERRRQDLDRIHWAAPPLARLTNENPLWRLKRSENQADQNYHLSLQMEREGGFSAESYSLFPKLENRPTCAQYLCLCLCLSICLFICLCVFVSFFSLCLCVSFPACRVGADRESTRNKSFYCFLKRFFVRALVTVVSTSRSTEHLGPFLTMSQ